MSNRPVSKSNFSAPVPAVSTPSPGDLVIECADFGKRPQCQKSFIFTLGEQQFYADPTRNYPAPRRCKPCRDAKKAERGDAPRPQESAPARNDSSDYRKVWDERSEAPRRSRRNRNDDEF